MDERRIFILGKTGAGKSSVANTIFGEELFNINHTANSDTSECRAETKSVNGRNITLIDTPGFFDTKLSEKELKSEIVRCITECAPGPHAFLIVLKVEKFTKQEQDVITEINKYFSEDVFKYATVLFTHGDQLEEEQTIEDFLCDDELVSDLVKKCGGRCHVVDNKYWKNNQQDEYRSNQFQVKKLLKTVEQMIEANGGRCYTNEMLQAVEEIIIQEEEDIRQSAGNMSEEEVREEAKDSVSKWLLISLAGITTGALLGALFGGVVMVRLVVSALEAGLALAKIATGVAAETGIAAATGVGAETGVAAATGVGAETGVAAATGVAAETGVGSGITAGQSLIALTATSAAVGAVAGGVAGYYAAQGADTLLEAAERAKKVVIDGSKSIVDGAKHCLK